MQAKRLAQHKQSARGFTLPTVLIMSLILLIIGVSTLQVNTAVNRSLVDQNWNLLAKTAAESGTVFANSCLKQATTWPSALTPGMNCDGSAATTITNCITPTTSPCVDTDNSSSAAPSRWQTTYTISAPSTGGDGLKRSQITGTVQILSASGIIVKTYTYSQDIILVIPLLPLPVHTCTVGIGPAPGVTWPSSIIVHTGEFLCLSTNVVNGAVVIHSGGGISSINSTINGSFGSTDNPGAQSVTLCNTHVNGTLDIQFSSGLVLVGDDRYACAGDFVNGAMSLQNNTAGVSLFTTSGGATIFKNNVGGAAPETIPKIGGNTISASLTCSGNTPSLTNDAQLNSASGARLPSAGGQCTKPF
jgi:Tfp pilus assembly protein PilX